MRPIIVEAKDAPCLDCGGEFPTESMHFDHVRGVKRFGLGQYGLRPIETIKAEIAKCEVVCGNCHAVRTEARRTEQKPPANDGWQKGDLFFEADK